MKKAIAFIVSLCFFTSLYAGNQSYTNGIEGLKSASLPPPGNYSKTYMVTYQADRLNNADGDKLPVDFDLGVYALVLRYIKVTDISFLGGNYIWDVIVPLQKIDFEMDALNLEESSSGLGDICLEPFGISWHGDQFDAACTVGAFLPTGDYDSEDPSSLGTDYYTGMLSCGMTCFFDKEKTWSFAILPRYEFHFERGDDDYRKGDDFHFEWGFGKNMNDFDFGLVGYGQMEMSNGDDAEEDSVWAVGAEVCYKSFLSLRALKEYEAEDKTEGWLTCLTVVMPL